jgi:hypothetical protein
MRGSIYLAQHNKHFFANNTVDAAEQERAVLCDHGDGPYLYVDVCTS